MILTIGFMALKSEKIDALSGAIPNLKEIIWRYPHMWGLHIPTLKSANQRPPPVRGIR